LENLLQLGPFRGHLTMCHVSTRGFFKFFI